MNDSKQKILDLIQDSVDVFYKVSPIQYRIRCPLCGDSNKNPKDAHLYIKCSFDPNEPVLYNCFKCNSGGIVNKYFLTKLDISPNEIPELEKVLKNKIPSVKKVNVDILTGDPIMDSKQAHYINRRLGKGFTVEDFNKFRIIWSIDTIIPYITDNRTRNSLPSNSNSISFLSSDKGTLLTRFFGDPDPRWRKSKLFPGSSQSFYTIKNTLDVFTTDPVVVNIGEGIFDVLSIYKNFNDGENSIYISSLGINYEGAIHYVIANGIIGDNVTLKVYIDTDINEKALQNKIKRYRWIFDKMYMYKNIRNKDFGVHRNNIQRVEYRI